ncbi:MAG TPA: hypothetical protein ENK86_05705 [Campylobacterales bacterium]|nr:hypothetical protein [Campylobacterales bacterium]
MNKLIYGVIIALFLGFAGSQIYQSLNQSSKSAKSSRLACHKQSIVFERIYKPELTSSMIEALQHGNVELKSKMKLSKYMTSQLGNYVKIEQVDSMFRTAISTHKEEKKSDKNLLIDYFVYENDKEDPGKKTAKSKLYAGYIRSSFILDGVNVYSVQIDFDDLQGRDIPESVRCTIESMVTLDRE